MTYATIIEFAYTVNGFDRSVIVSYRNCKDYLHLVPTISKDEKMRSLGCIIALGTPISRKWGWSIEQGDSRR